MQLTNSIFITLTLLKSFAVGYHWDDGSIYARSAEPSPDFDYDGLFAREAAFEDEMQELLVRGVPKCKRGLNPRGCIQSNTAGMICTPSDSRPEIVKMAGKCKSEIAKCEGNDVVLKKSSFTADQLRACTIMCHC